MYVAPPDPIGDFLLSRRLFLGSCSMLALALAACGTVGPRTRFGARMLTDPAARDYRPVLQGLVRAILPFEDPRFPLTPEDTGDRLLDLFPIDDGEAFLGLQRALTFFEDVHLFPHLFGPLVRAESKPDPAGAGSGLPDDRVAALRSNEQRLYRRFQRSLEETPERFTELSLEDQRAYLRIWGASAFSTKRQFAGSVRSLIMITAYSTKDLWQAIGYAGPVLEEARATP